jgi:pyruvate carboxylase
LAASRVPAHDHRQAPPRARDSCCWKLGPKKFAEWTLKQKPLLITSTTFRDAHQSLLATRMRTYDILTVADAVARRTPNLYSGGDVGRARRSIRRCVSSSEDPWTRLRALRAKIPNICFQMFFRGSNAVGYSNYPDNAVAGFVKHAAEAAWIFSASSIR